MDMMQLKISFRGQYPEFTRRAAAFHHARPSAPDQRAGGVLQVKLFVREHNMVMQTSE
jgi:hypothetical protein